MRRALAALLVGLALAACGSPPTAKEEPDVVAEALRAFDRGDWVAAARLLREAVAKQPTDLRLHYSLAVTVTHLELREEAIREFQWVLANAPAGSPEAIAARNWLLAAGVLTNPSVAGNFSDSGDDVDGGTATDPDHPEGAVHGQVTWTDGDPTTKGGRMQLFLKGIKVSTSSACRRAAIGSWIGSPASRGGVSRSASRPDRTWRWISRRRTASAFGTTFRTASSRSK